MRFEVAHVLRPLCPVGGVCMVGEERRASEVELGEGE